jgi:SulP family sulfate permease
VAATGSTGDGLRRITGLPAFVGLATMIGPLLVYALLGSSRQLSVGPESTTALMTATAIAPSWRRCRPIAAATATAAGRLVAVALEAWALGSASWRGS